MSVSSLAVSHSRCFTFSDKVFKGKTMMIFFFFFFSYQAGIWKGWDQHQVGSAAANAVLFEPRRSWLTGERCQPMLGLHTLCGAAPIPTPARPTPPVGSLVGLIGIGAVPRGKENSWQPVKKRKK